MEGRLRLSMARARRGIVFDRRQSRYRCRASGSEAHRRCAFPAGRGDCAAGTPPDRLCAHPFFEHPVQRTARSSVRAGNAKRGGVVCVECLHPSACAGRAFSFAAALGRPVAGHRARNYRHLVSSRRRLVYAGADPGGNIDGDGHHHRALQQLVRRDHRRYLRHLFELHGDADRAPHDLPAPGEPARYRCKGRLEDSLINYETVKSFANEGLEAARFHTIMDRWAEAALTNQKALFALHVGQSAIIAVGVASIMLLAGAGVMAHRMTVGDLVLINAYMLQVCLPLNTLGFVYREAKDAMVNTEKMFELLREKPEIEEPPGQPELKVERADVVFENVSFSYEPARPILENINFRIPPGGTVAVVG